MFSRASLLAHDKNGIILSHVMHMLTSREIVAGLLVGVAMLAAPKAAWQPDEKGEARAAHLPFGRNMWSGETVA